MIYIYQVDKVGRTVRQDPRARPGRADSGKEDPKADFGEAGSF